MLETRSKCISEDSDQIKNHLIPPPRKFSNELVAMSFNSNYLTSLQEVQRWVSQRQWRRGVGGGRADPDTERAARQLPAALLYAPGAVVFIKLFILLFIKTWCDEWYIPISNLSEEKE